MSVSITLQDVFMSVFKNASGTWSVDLHWFRTLLHVPLYFALGMMAYFTFPRFWLSSMICTIVALADETLKIFLPTREFEVRDLGFDIIGFLLGIAMMFVLRVLVNKIRGNNKSQQNI